MTWLDKYNDTRDRLEAGNAYDRSSERDACGVGLVCSIDGTPRRDVVEYAIRSLKAVAHRGAVDPDGLSGDGAGIMAELPQGFFAEQVASIGQSLRPGPICVGQVFLPRTDLGAQDRARAIVETEALRAGFWIYGWRQTPIDLSVVGTKAGRPGPRSNRSCWPRRWTTPDSRWMARRWSANCICAAAASKRRSRPRTWPASISAPCPRGP